MSTEVILFAILASWTALSALAVAISQNIVHSAVWLLFTLIGVSLLYFLLGADFLGASQLIVYVGGTLVLVIFGIMLTAQGPFLKLRTPSGEYMVAGTVAAVLFGLLVMTSITVGERPAPRAKLAAIEVEKVEDKQLVGVGALGLAFMNVREATPPSYVSGLPKQLPGNLPLQRMGYLLPFEIVSVHLLVVLIGAAYLARAKRKRINPPVATAGAGGAP